MAVAAILNDPTFWREAREIMLPVARRVFREAYLIGAALGARERPEGVDFEIRNPALQLGQMLRVGARAFGDGDYPGVRGHQPLPADGQAFTPLPFDFDAIRTAAEDVINEYSDEWWGGLEASTQRSMRRTMVRALDEGWTLDRITREFEPLFGPERAQRIAVAETTTLMGRGAMATYQRAGMEFWIWRTSEDTRVDADCAALARQSDPKKGGTPFPMTRQFNRAHVGCRCWPVPYGPPRDTRPVTEPERQLGEGVQYGQPGWFDTEALYTEDAPGGGRRWKPDRVRDVHDPIVQELTGKARPVRQPTAYMMGGGPASGKSTVINQGFVKVPENIVSIDPDGIKAMLPEYQRMVALGDARAAGFVHEESSYLSKRVLREAAESKKNVLLDGTGDSGIDKLAAKVRDMRAGGQRVVAQYVSLDTELAVRNATARAIKTGRAVDENVIRNTHRAVTEVFPEAVERGLFDEVTLWDTNINGQPRKVLEAVKDANGTQQVTIHSRQLWSDFLGKANLRPGTFQFELSATYAEAPVVQQRAASAVREAILKRPDVQRWQALDEGRTAIQTEIKAHQQTFNDVVRRHRELGFNLNDPPAGSPYHLYQIRATELRAQAAKAHAEIVAHQTTMQQAILTEEGIYANSSATFALDRTEIDTLQRGASAAARKQVEKGIEDFSRLVGPNSPIEGQPLRFVKHRGSRDYYIQNRIAFSTKTNAETVVHEMGHWLEHHSDEVQAARKAHVAKRTVGERPQRMQALQPGYGYGRDEIAYKDEFFNPYAGKVYQGRPDSSELISMGLEEMYARPWELAAKDPRLFDFIHDLLMSWR